DCQKGSLLPSATPLRSAQTDHGFFYIYFLPSGFGNCSSFIWHHLGRSLQHIRALGIITMIPGVRQKFDYNSHVTPLHDIFFLFLFGLDFIFAFGSLGYHYTSLS
ncbi:hypothetical protein LY78DRAFT_728527, partial [Colletotrichum sublineola]